VGGPLEVDVDPGRVWRVGYPLVPWAWTPGEYAGPDGRFGGRWDDSVGEFRTIYAGQSVLGCLLEVLAVFRPDPELADALSLVQEDPADAVGHPPPPPGRLPRAWLTSRTATSAELAGVYAAVTRPGSLAALRARFGSLAARAGLGDLDAGALKLPTTRELTQGGGPLVVRPAQLSREPTGVGSPLRLPPRRRPRTVGGPRTAR